MLFDIFIKWKILSEQKTQISNGGDGPECRNFCVCYILKGTH